MNIKPIFTQAPPDQREAGLIRIGLAIAITPTKKEEALFETPFFIPSKKPVPVKLFDQPKRGVTGVATQRFIERNDEKSRCQAFWKSGIVIDSCVPGAHLNIGAPGEILFGYFNPDDDSRITAWINDEVANLAQEITRRVTAAIDGTKERNIQSRAINIDLTDDRARKLAASIQVDFQRVATGSRLIRKL